MAQRINTHKMETLSRDWVRSIIDADDNALFRELSERDYGVDALIEIFCKGEVTGEIAFVQLKSTEKTIRPLKNAPLISCKMTTASIHYAFQNRIPYIILYISISKPEICYWGLLQDIVTDDIAVAAECQQTVTVHIPQDQYFSQDSKLLLREIEEFYNRKYDEAVET